MILWVGVLCLAATSLSLLAVLGVTVDLYLKNKLFPVTVTSRMITHSCWESISPGTLLTFRLSYLLFSVAILIYSYITNFPTLLAFFTLWNYHLQTLYFGLVVWFTIRSRPSNTNKDGGGLSRTIFVINLINTAMVCLVAVILWSVILPDKLKNNDGKSVLNFESYSEHAINVPFVLAEFMLNGMRLQTPHHIVFLILWGNIYAVFCIVFQFFGGFSPYFFADISQKITPLWLVGVQIIILVFYVVPFGLDRLKGKWGLKTIDVESPHLMSDHT